MMDDVQMFRTPSGDEMVIMPRAVYEDLIDARAARDAKAALARGDEELLSEEEMRELLESPSALAFWRRKRNLRQDMLAEALGFSQGYISDIENGKRRGGIKFYQRAAIALQVPLGSILPADEEDHDAEPGESPEFAPEVQSVPRYRSAPATKTDAPRLVSRSKAVKPPKVVTIEKVARSSQTGQFLRPAARAKTGAKGGRYKSTK